MTLLILIKLLIQQQKNPEHVKNLQIKDTLGLVFSFVICGLLDVFCIGYTFYSLIIKNF